MKNSFILKMAKGFIVGAAGIIPGASGGVIAVSMGIYRPVLDAIYAFFTDFRKNFKGSFLFLLPLGIGCALGIYACSLLLEWLLTNYEAYLMYALIGLVLGGLPSFFREANSCGFRPRYLLGTLFGAALTTGLALLEDTLGVGESWAFNGWTAFFAGALIMVGIVIPGMSTSFVLMYLDLYAPLLNALTRLNLPVLFCAGMGALLVGVGMVFFVRRMFARHHGFAYYAVFGFLLGTLVMIFPGLGKGYALVLQLALVALGATVSYLLAKEA